MIITPERLIDLAKQDVEKRARNHNVRCAFVVGSAVRGDPLLGGAADVDVIVIHRDLPLRDRIIERLSQDVHLDLYQYGAEQIDPPRELRLQPLLGPAVAAGERIYDPEHYFDWLQAGVRAHFHRPDQQLARARAWLDQARAAAGRLPDDDIAWTQAFARAAFTGANAGAVLADGPVAGRRAALILRQRFAAAERSDLFADFLELLGINQAAGWDLSRWLSGWAKAYDAALARKSELTLSQVRRDYFLRGFQALADAEQAPAVLLPLLVTWQLPQDQANPDDAAQSAWIELQQATGLQLERRDDKARQLEQYFDQLEIYLEHWGETHGA